MDDQKSQAIATLFNIVENDPENREDALVILAHLTEMWLVPEDCSNHMADSWGCCENCGRMVF